jgi:hypothetical protein
MCLIHKLLLTLEGPTPTNISKNSEPDTEIKGTLASPAVALASIVLPVPGGPLERQFYLKSDLIIRQNTRNIKITYQ